MKNLIYKALCVKDMTQVVKAIGAVMIFVGLQVQAVGAEGMQIALVTVGALFVILAAVFVWAKRHHEFGEDA